MSIPTEVFENISYQLSAVIGGVLDDDSLAQPATLADVRQAVLAREAVPSVPLNRFSSDDVQQLHDEIDALIEEFGDDALAIRFLRPGASEALSRLMEAGMDDDGRVTLGELFEAAERGLLAHLIGEGEIDDDEAQTVLGELQALIDQYGPSALVENFDHEA
jgi:hypothetical protein